MCQLKRISKDIFDALFAWQHVVMYRVPKWTLKVMQFRARWHCISKDSAMVGQSERCIVQ